MSEKKIVVPQGMLGAARIAERESGSGGVGEYDLRIILEASLRWLSENPIVPTKQQVCETLTPVQVQSPSTFALFTEAWQRRMFLAREPEVPEAIANLLVDSCAHVAVDSDYINDRVREAYRRGQQTKP